jgi:DNA topoisomerase I
MARRGGWRRLGSRGRFRYVDARGRPIADEAALERIELLRIPPAWRDVRISPRPHAKLQATGVDSAGRVQYLYHPDFRAQQEQAKFDKLIRFAEKLPDLRAAMAEHMSLEPLEPEWTTALAVRLINLGWFRVGDERYARRFRTFGITTLRKSHIEVRGSRIIFCYRAKHRALVRTAFVDAELADAIRELKPSGAAGASSATGVTTTGSAT